MNTIINKIKNHLPKYILEQPSTRKKITFRPFTVKEEKNLQIETASNGIEALEHFVKRNSPQNTDDYHYEMIFMDKEMPLMNGLEAAKFIQSKKGSLETGMALADAYAMFGNTNNVNTEMQKFNRVTRADLQRVARKYLGTNNRVVLQFMPSTEKKSK